MLGVFWTLSPENVFSVYHLNKYTFYSSEFEIAAFSSKVTRALRKIQPLIITYKIFLNGENSVTEDFRVFYHFPLSSGLKPCKFKCELVGIGAL